MAIIKEIKNKFGITATYHRIYNIEKGHGSLKVTLKSYINEGYRDLEKEFDELKEKNKNATETLFKLTSMPEEDRDKEKIEKIEQDMARLSELNQLFYDNPNGVGSGIFNTTYVLDWPADRQITFENIYAELNILLGIG